VSAANNTKNQIDRFIKNLTSISSLFVHTGEKLEDVSELLFKKMYGKYGKMIHINDLTNVAKELNKDFYKKLVD
jgi:hypothetical protein